ncbi:MAG: hypothetical protein OHK0023_16300 [Anaerolineae bacterium]
MVFWLHGSFNHGVKVGCDVPLPRGTNTGAFGVQSDWAIARGLLPISEAITTPLLQAIQIRR